jgi:hypothetical protein
VPGVPRLAPARAANAGRRLTPVAALNFRPVRQLVADADARLAVVEGKAFEKLVSILDEERSRKGLGDFPPHKNCGTCWPSTAGSSRI